MTKQNRTDDGPVLFGGRRVAPPLCNARGANHVDGVLQRVEVRVADELRRGAGRLHGDLPLAEPSKGKIIIEGRITR